MKKLSFFDILTSINSGPETPDILGDTLAHEENVSPDSPSKAYNAFMINRGLSYFQDTILLANQLNIRSGSDIPPRMQYDFLRNTIRPRRRFSKWFKKEADSDDIKLIMENYNYSSQKAHEALSLFTPESLTALRLKRSRGGKA